MDVFHIILTMVIAQIFIAMVPGPNNASHSRALGFASAFGIFPAGLFWASAGAAGSGTLLRLHPQFLTVMYVLCGSYLVWLGVKVIRSSFRETIFIQKAVESLTVRDAFKAGVISNLTNPKTIAYYASIFTATGTYVMPIPYQVLTVILMPVVSFCWFCCLITMVSNQAVRSRLEGSRHWLDRIAGAIMMGFGFRLLMMLVV